MCPHRVSTGHTVAIQLPLARIKPQVEAEKQVAGTGGDDLVFDPVVTTMSGWMSRRAPRRRQDIGG